MEELEKALASTKVELDSFVDQKATLENALETALAECKETLQSLKESKHIIDELDEYLILKHLSREKEETALVDNYSMTEITKLKMTVERLELQLKFTQSNLTVEKELRNQFEQEKAKEHEKRITLSNDKAVTTQDQTALVMENHIKEIKEKMKSDWQDRFEKYKQRYIQKELDLKAEVTRLKSSLRKEKDQASLKKMSYAKNVLAFLGMLSAAL